MGQRLSPPPFSGRRLSRSLADYRRMKTRKHRERHSMTYGRRLLGGWFLVAVLSQSALAFDLSSPSVSDGNWDKKFLAKECGGQNRSPALAWTDPPAGTKSFVLTLFDRDALDGFGWWHWQVLKIPRTVTDLPEGAGTRGSKGLPKGAIQGKADLGRR